MTISSTNRKVSYNGNGSQTVFPITFAYTAADQIKAIKVETDGSETVWTKDTHFTVDIVDDEVNTTVGNTLATGEAVVIYRDIPLTQETDYPENDPFPSSSHEAALDKLTLIAQDQQEAIDRAIKLSISSSLSDLVIPVPDAGKTLIWNATADGLENGPDAIDIAAAEANAAIAASSAEEASTSAAAAADSAIAAAAAVGGIKVSSNDTTVDNLEAKLLVASGHLSLSTQNDGANETRTISLPNSGVTASSYTSANITVDAQGRITAASNGIVGKVAQVVSTQTGAVATGTTDLPWDDTIPQNTEGDQFMSLSITPTNASSNLVITVDMSLSNADQNNITAALFQDSTANALAAASQYLASTGGDVRIGFTHIMTAGTTSSTTFKVRGGAGIGSGTTTFNGVGGNRKFGGVLSSSIVITEVLP